MAGLNIIIPFFSVNQTTGDPNIIEEFAESIITQGFLWSNKIRPHRNHALNIEFLNSVYFAHNIDWSVLVFLGNFLGYLQQ